MDIFSDQFAGYLRQMLYGAVITIELFMSGFVLALIFGTAAGITGSLSQSIIVQGIYRVYLSIITGVPSLLIIFLIYYGGSAMLTSLFGRSRSFDVTPFSAGVASLTIVYSAYIAELVRGAKRMTVENSVALLDYPYERAHWRSIARTFDKPFLYVVTPQFEQQAVNLKKNRPATQIEVFKKAGHALFADEPERFNALIEKFAKRLS